MNKEMASPAAPDRATQASPEARSGLRHSVSVPDAAWLIWATEGEYSDRSEWPIAIIFDQQAGEQITERLGELWRALHAIYRRREDELDAAGDHMGETLFDTTEEGREYERLTGARGYLGGCYADDRSFTCCSVRVLDASAMSAGTAETAQQAQGEARQRGGEAETPNRQVQS